MTVARAVARAVASPVARAVVSGDSGSGTDADAAVYFAAVEGAGGSFDLTSVDPTYTEDYSKSVWDTAIKALKGQSATLNPSSLDVWSKIYEFNAHFGVTQAGHLQKIKYASGKNAALTDVSVTSYIAAGSGAGAVGRMNSDIIGTDIGATCFLFVYATVAQSSGGGRLLYTVTTTNRPMIYASAIGTVQGVYNAFVNFSGDAGLLLLNQNDLWRNGTKGVVSGGSLTPSANAVAINTSSNARLIFSGCGNQKMTDAEAVVFSSVLNWAATQFGSNTY